MGVPCMGVPCMGVPYATGPLPVKLPFQPRPGRALALLHGAREAASAAARPGCSRPRRLAARGQAHRHECIPPQAGGILPREPRTNTAGGKPSMQSTSDCHRTLRRTGRQDTRACGAAGQPTVTPAARSTRTLLERCAPQHASMMRALSAGPRSAHTPACMTPAGGRVHRQRAHHHSAYTHATPHSASQAPRRPQRGDTYRRDRSAHPWRQSSQSSARPS